MSSVSFFLSCPCMLNVKYLHFQNLGLGFYWVLTLSSQLHPKSSVTTPTGPEGVGLETSSGMAGLWAGTLSRWFRLPWVPLLGAGFRPSRSVEMRDKVVQWPSIHAALLDCHGVHRMSELTGLTLGVQHYTSADRLCTVCNADKYHPVYSNRKSVS